MANRQTRVLSARCAFFAYLLLPVIGYAQSTFGDIRGTTRDPAGLALPQAVVTLHNLDDNTTRSASPTTVEATCSKTSSPATTTVSAAKDGIFRIVHGHRGTHCSSERPCRRDVIHRAAAADDQRGKRGGADQYRERYGGRHPGHGPTGRDAAQFQSPDHQSAGCAWPFLRASSRIARATYKWVAPLIR